MPTERPARLHKRIAAVAPIHGLRFSTADEDIAGVTIDFKDEATQTERDAAAALLASLTNDDLDQPVRVTKYQFKRALLDANRLDDVKAQAPNLTPEALLYWEDATYIEIDSVLIQELQALMGFTDAQVKTFFTNAAGI